MTVRIKNTDIVSHTWSGQTVAAAGFYDIQAAELQGFKDSTKVFTAVSNGTAVISDGAKDFINPIQGWDLLTGSLPTQVELPIVSPNSGRPEVVIVAAEGNGTSIPSHDFTNKSTWWQESIRITDETPVLESGKTYTLTKTYIIDCQHGNITFEMELNMANSVIVKDNDVALTMDTDYTVDYVNGKITFDAGYTITGPLLVTYSYATSSGFTVKPGPGERYVIAHSELQFTNDMSMKPITFDIWAYNPADLPNKVIVFSKTYKNIKDIIAIAKNGVGVIKAILPLTKDVLVFPFEYNPVISLSSAAGMELRISTKDDSIMGGEWGMMTVYAKIETE